MADDGQVVEQIPFNETGLADLRMEHNWWLHITTFTIWTTAVAVFTTIIVSKCMKSSSNPSEEFFSGGRGLAWFIVAGSLMLTNLSTEQLVGLNGTIFKDGCMAGVAWETFAALAMCITAIVFVPTYARSGLTTTTGFLGERFDKMTRTLVSVIFLIYYTVVTCPMVLYTGGLAMKTIFDLDKVPLWVISTLIGILGAIYALTGGLKAVAVSDCLNGIGLIIFGVWVPLQALSLIGGIDGLFSEPSYLKPFARRSMIWDNDKASRSEDVVSVPWSVLMTGLMVNNLYYWSTNQLIVQRVLGAKSLAHGQKGVMFAATMKVIGFSFLCLPGVIGMLMMKKGVMVKGKPFVVPTNDQVYPLVVKAVMPEWSLGFFAAVLLGSVLSTFNSALNSASTLFGLEIYQIYINPGASDQRVVTIATWFGVAVSLFSFVLAPFLQGLGSIFIYLQKVNSMASLPIVTIFFVGIATKLPDAFAAKLGFAVGVGAYGACQFLTSPHWLHLFFMCFLLACATMMIGTYAKPLRRLFCVSGTPKMFEPKKANAVVDLTPWAPLNIYCVAVAVLVAVISVALQIGSKSFFYVFWAAWLGLLFTLFALPVGESDGDSSADENSDESSASLVEE
mmetsp:Transcript_3826/g.11248  ORF Transcript_3826/g.11248 Transcript_3826/m.11248 type:complete len:619 (-) Transcript_3826:98-1954(-)|eukprot:CAMPEP_0168381652 /NCGR_PEP_ID=MMETSP0228-20121227/12987_1 /TAXON_ID=133427 /ORGANISM="Protoceratium reticulatum, Strain CCCM 535 (=CCMP 1889)" /LENGTH=618 /DNA_ID=CAMNT_0008394757 /DNA_START=76 /DNA_END=1932 /DNA_ORIENTATION=-